MRRVTRSDFAHGAWFYALLGATMLTPVGGVIALLLPVPLTLLVARGRWKRAAFHAGTALIILSILGSIVSALLILLFVSAFSYVLGIGFQKNQVKRALVNATLVATVFFIAGLILMRMSGIAILPLIMTEVKRTLTADPRMTLLGGQSLGSAAKLLQSQVKLYFPGFIVILGGIGTLLNAAVTRVLLNRSDPGSDPVFRYLQFPKIVVGIYLLCFLLLIGDVGRGSVIVSALVNNVFLIASFLMTVQALSLLWFYLQKRALGVWIMLLAVLLSLVSVIGILYLLLGILDVSVDFRSRAKKT
ncbi:MAG: DUF2232 domain-containing protein [Bacilli bacterium]